MKEPNAGTDEGSPSTVGPGTRLNGVFEIDELIAIGGMGRVYRGRALETGDSVAIKMIRPELAENDTYLALFRKEASALHRTPHDAIVRYYVFTTDPALQCPYLAMEFVAGDSLSNILKRQPLDLAAVRVLQKRLASGLDAAHRLGVIHRDVSPDNIILPDNDPHRAKLIDFGIARDSLGGATVIGGDFAGKSNFASPEQIGLFGGTVTAKTDIYSLGLTLAAALLGAPLKMSGTPADLVVLRQNVPDLSGIDPQIRPLLEHMLQPDPANRPASMAEIAAWPDAAPASSDDMTIVSVPAGETAANAKEPRRAALRRFGWPAAAAALVAVVGVGLAGGYFRADIPTRNSSPETVAASQEMSESKTPSLSGASESKSDGAANVTEHPAQLAGNEAAATAAAALPQPPPGTRVSEPPARTEASAQPGQTGAAIPAETSPLPQKEAAAARAAPEPAVVTPPTLKATAPGAFRDCPTCPELIVLPTGSFTMGSNADSTERPVHKVNIAGFAIGRLPVTVEEWRLCFKDKGCGFQADGDPAAPVHNLSWDDAQQYVSWLSRVTGHPYRLPSEAEWEYAARAETTTRYWWGNQFEPEKAACRSCSASVPSDPPLVGAHPANAFGLRDVIGSVAQWVADCWHKDFHGAPTDGSAWVAAHCPQRVLRGGSWTSNPTDLRVSGREFYDQSVRYPGHGLRVARGI